MIEDKAEDGPPKQWSVKVKVNACRVYEVYKVYAETQEEAIERANNCFRPDSTIVEKVEDRDWGWAEVTEIEDCGCWPHPCMCYTR